MQCYLMSHPIFLRKKENFESSNRLGLIELMEKKNFISFQLQFPQNKLRYKLNECTPKIS